MVTVYFSNKKSRNYPLGGTNTVTQLKGFIIVDNDALLYGEDIKNFGITDQGDSTTALSGNTMLQAGGVYYAFKQ